MSGFERDRENSSGTDRGRAKQMHRRASVRVPIRISTIDPEQDPRTGKLYFFTSEEFSADLSRGGAFVTTLEPIEPGRRLLLELDIPNGANIQTIGRVKWKRIGTGQTSTSMRDRPGIGIEFTSGRPDLFNELERYVEKVSARRRPVGEVNSESQVTT